MFKNVLPKIKLFFLILLFLLGAVLASQVNISAKTSQSVISNEQEAIYFQQPEDLGGNYHQILQFLSENPEADERFGADIDMNENFMAIGAPRSNNEQGALYLYEHNLGVPNQWVFVARITASDGNIGDRFGHEVAISGNTLAVGAYQNDDFGFSSGAAYIFEKDQGGPSSWGEVVKILPSDGASNDRFGWDVAISGDFLAVGAYWDDDVCCNSGSVYIFERNAGGTNHWGQVAKLTASDAANNDYFGRAIRLDGNTLVVGSQACDTCDNSNKTGKAYVFERDMDGIWSQTNILTASDAANGDNFGIDIGISGDLIIVGASDDDDNGNKSGSAYIFERNLGGTTAWGEVTKLTASDGMAADEYGWGVDIDSNIAVVGALYGNGFMVDSGNAYVYEQDQGGMNVWGEFTQLIPQTGNTNEGFGTSLAISGDYILVSAPLYDDTAGIDQGASFLFEYFPPPLANNDFGLDFTTNEDTPFTTGDVLANDTGTLPLSLAAVDTTNLLGLLTSNGDGTFNYDPDGQFEFLASGEQALDTFSYTIADTYGLTATANVTITILGVNDAPALDFVTLNPPEINENNAVTLSGNFTDMDLNDAHILTLAWGDGFTDTLNLQTGAYYFLATHSYPDDNPTVTPSDIYTLTVFLSDAFVTVSNTLPLTVNNVAPLLTNLPVFTVDENAIATLTGTLTDPSLQDSFTLVVAWGDGATLTYTYPAGTQSFAASHLYLDDNPSGTPLDTYSITLNLWDDDSGFTAATTNVEVVNLPPLANAGPDLTLEAGSPITLAGSFTDPGPLDTHTIFWDFGDGTNTTGTLTPLHLYTIPNTYTVTLTITDDDSGIGMDTLLVHVTEPAPFTFYLFLPLVKNCTLWWECLQ